MHFFFHYNKTFLACAKDDKVYVRTWFVLRTAWKKTNIKLYDMNTK